jgi:hypothetical protein
MMGKRRVAVASDHFLNTSQRLQGLAKAQFDGHEPIQPFIIATSRDLLLVTRNSNFFGYNMGKRHVASACDHSPSTPRRHAATTDGYTLLSVS